jgi:hypothetical protein
MSFLPFVMCMKLALPSQYAPFGSEEPEQAERK